MLKWLRGNAFGKVTQGKWPAAKGEVAAHNSYSAAKPEYNLRRHIILMRRTYPSGEARSP